MLVDGSGDNGLAFVYDQANEQDSLDGRVASHWPFGIRAIGKTEWKRTLRVALRAHDSEPWLAKQQKENQYELLGLLRERGIQAAIVVQSPATPGIRQVHSAWNMLGHPGNPYQWAGTVERRGGLYVCPLLHPANYEYIYGWLIERWIRQAHAVARGQLRPLVWAEPCIEPGARMHRILTSMLLKGEPLSVDIETNMAGTMVSAIGLSDGKESVSCPWHGYSISGLDGERQQPLSEYEDGCSFAELITQIVQSPRISKILHNGAFDVMELAKHGLRLEAFTYDTLLMHRVVYPQYRHGLQVACATEFAIEPWKSLYKPAKVSGGQDAWLGDPLALRTYNSKDAQATWHLWNHLEKKLG